MTKYIKLYSKKTDEKGIEQCVNLLKKGGVIVYPTDSVYAMGVSLQSVQGIDRLHEIKKVKKGEHDFSIICADLSMISSAVAHLTKTKFKILKKNLPGSFTFILETNIKFPKKLNINRKTLGVRIPANNIPRLLSEKLGHPLLTTSIKLKTHNDYNEYMTDPEIIYKLLGKYVDMVIDGGEGNNQGSTVVDLQTDEPIILRQGMAYLS